MMQKNEENVEQKFLHNTDKSFEKQENSRISEQDKLREYYESKSEISIFHITQAAEMVLKEIILYFHKKELKSGQLPALRATLKVALETLNFKE